MAETIFVHLLQPTAVVPCKSNPSDTGFDLVSPIDTSIQPGEQICIPLGLIICFPPGINTNKKFVFGTNV